MELVNQKNKEWILFYICRICTYEEEEMFSFSLKTLRSGLNVKEIYLSESLRRIYREEPVENLYFVESVSAFLLKLRRRRGPIMILDHHIALHLEYCDSFRQFLDQTDLNYGFVQKKISDEKYFFLENNCLIINNLETISFMDASLENFFQDKFYADIPLEDIRQSPLADKFWILEIDKKWKKCLYELNFLHTIGKEPLFLFSNRPMSYELDNEYLFYPQLDLEYPMVYLEPPLPEKYCAYNSNQFYVTEKILPSKLYPHFFKRFLDKRCGLYLQRKTSLLEEQLIPRKFHILYLLENPDSKIFYAWRKILKNEWECCLWTLTDLREKVFKPDDNGINKWETIFDTIGEYYRPLIASIAILEKNGGVLVEGSAIPLQKIPDDFLYHPFFTSFLDERKSTTRLSLRILGSCPYPLVFQKIYYLFCSQQLTYLEKIIIEHPDTLIYPSYYFHLTYSDQPLLRRRTIFYFLQKRPKILVYKKPYLIYHPYQSQAAAIQQTLLVNPRDRL